MVTLRGIRARSGQSLALFVMGTLTMAGCIVAVGYSRATHASVGSAGALLLLAVVALAGQGAASVRARRSEIALAQLRGGHGLALLRRAVTEPSVILLVAAVAGVAVGRVVARGAVHRWVGDDATFEMTRAEWATAAAVLVVSVAVVVVVSWHTAYEPLTAKLAGLDRPRPTTTAGLLLGLLTLMGALVSVYQARQLGVRHADWVSFLSPALVGLAAGQIGIWSVAILSQLAMGFPRLNGSLRWFLTLRRLTRRSDSTALIRIVVAAVVVAGVAASAWVGSGSWRDQTARIETGGPVAFEVPTGGLQAYAASHQADPHGRWLMAISASPDPSGGSFRDMFVDTPRWDRVVGTFFSGTPVAAVSHEIGSLAQAPALRPARGSTFAVTFSAQSVRRAWPTARIERTPASWQLVPLLFTISYVDSQGDGETLQVPQNPGRRPRSVRPGGVGYSALVPGCARACALESVRVQGLTHQAPLHVTNMSFADSQLIPGDAADMVLSREHTIVRAVPSRGGLDLWLTTPYESRVLLDWSDDPVPAALVTPGLRLERAGGQPQAYGPDGDPHPVRIAGQVPALPLLGRSGLLLDLGTALRGAGGQLPDTETVVVARADTPVRVLHELSSTGAVGRKLTFGQVLTDIDRTRTAQGAVLYGLIAVFGLLIAAISVASSTVEQRRERRVEAASLRVVGVDVADVAGGYRAEAEGLGAAVTVVAGVAVWIGCRALLPVLPLVEPGRFGLLFDATPRGDLVAGLAVAAGTFVTLVIFLGFRLVGRSSPPSVLRAEDR
ncbi:MAG: FtsX-like permease family protein [Nocardioidaceae bacterium]